jgi:hypothetical protein
MHLISFSLSCQKNTGYKINMSNNHNTFFDIDIFLKLVFDVVGKSGLVFVFVFVYLPTDLSLTDNFHKFQLKIRLQTSRKQKSIS